MNKVGTVGVYEVRVKSAKDVDEVAYVVAPTAAAACACIKEEVQVTQCRYLGPANFHDSLFASFGGGRDAAPIPSGGDERLN